MSPSPTWVPFGAEDHSKPEVRANVALAYAFSSPAIGPWLRQKLSLPPESMILSARFSGIRHRPDLSVFMENKLNSVIECELGARDPWQELSFSTVFGVPVHWIVGQHTDVRDLLWQEICVQARAFAEQTPPNSRGALLMLAAVIEKSLGEPHVVRISHPLPGWALTPTWFGGAFLSLLALLSVGKLANLPFSPQSISLRLVASPPLKPGQRDGLSLLTKRGSARFVRLISPDKLRHYLQGGTKWVDQYDVALTSVMKSWRTRIDKDGMLSVSDLEVAPYASEFDRAYRAFGEEIGVTTLS